MYVQIRQTPLEKTHALLEIWAANPSLHQKRKNASTKAGGCHAWKEMIDYKREHPKDFENKYHKRSNSKATYSSFKRKFGGFLYSRK